MENQGKPRAKVTQNTKILVKLLENELQEKGLSQKELAGKAGISEPTLSRIFKLSRVPDINELSQICSVLHLRLSEVVRQAEKELAESPASPATPPLSDEYITQLEQDLTSGKYAYAAYTTPHNPADEIDSVGEESQIPDGWEE